MKQQATEQSYYQNQKQRIQSYNSTEDYKLIENKITNQDSEIELFRNDNENHLKKKKDIRYSSYLKNKEQYMTINKESENEDSNSQQNQFKYLNDQKNN